MYRPDAVHPWHILDEEPISQQKIFTMLRTTSRSPDSGREHRSVRLQAADWVNIIALDCDHQLLLVEQYRHGTRSVTLEIPGGAVDPGETPATAAARELEEETGFAPGELVEIGVVEPNPAFLSNRCWTFLATGCRSRHRLNPDCSEEIVVHRRPLPDFTGMIDDGAITHALVIAAHDHLQRGRARGAPWARRLSR